MTRPADSTSYRHSNDFPNRTMRLMCAIGILLAFSPSVKGWGDYPWLSDDEVSLDLAEAIQPPEGFQRVPTSLDSFGSWLRHLPIKAGTPPVRLYDGTLKFNQRAQYVVVDIDVGNRDLQQCADAVIRLRAEYLFSRQALESIEFRFTNGTRVPYLRWREGERPVVRGNKVSWTNRHAADSSYASFRKYLNTLFIYAGTISLTKDLRHIGSTHDICIGDVFLESGSPGHAVLVADVAQNPNTGQRVFLLAQSYMPAQDIHILVNPRNEHLNPWFSPPTDGPLVTPEWTFPQGSLYRFPQVTRSNNGVPK